MADERLVPDGRPSVATPRPHRSRRLVDRRDLVRPLVHGAVYFQRLYDELCALEAGDRVYFTDWRGMPTRRCTGRSDGRSRVVRPGAIGRRSTGTALAVAFGSPVVQRAGEPAARDRAQRGRRGGAARPAGPAVGIASSEAVRDPASGCSAADVAFVGGIDLCHGRRDDARHLGDPQQAPMDPRYGDRTPWHDVALEIRGPVVGDLLRTFVERWDDPHPLDRRTPYRMPSSAKRGCRGILRRCLRRFRIRLRPGSTQYRCCGPMGTSIRGFPLLSRANTALRGPIRRRSGGLSG